MTTQTPFEMSNIGVMSPELSALEFEKK